MYLMHVTYRKSLGTNWKKALSKWQLADLFVIKTTQRSSLTRITRINFHFTYRWVFAAEWSSMGNPPGCKLPHNMLPIVRVKSEIDTHQGKEDHWKCCSYRPLKVRILALVRQRKSVTKEQKWKRERILCITCSYERNSNWFSKIIPLSSSFRTLKWLYYRH